MADTYYGIRVHTAFAPGFLLPSSASAATRTVVEAKPR